MGHQSIGIDILSIKGILNDVGMTTIFDHLLGFMMFVIGNSMTVIIDNNTMLNDVIKKPPCAI